MKIAVLGGLGMQGKAALLDLARSSRVREIVCADASLKDWEKLAAITDVSKIKPVQVDGSSKKAIVALFRQGFDAAIDLLPLPFMANAFEAALQTRVPDFPALQERIGMNLAVPPFKDERFDTGNIGYLAPLICSYIYYRSEPFPLERAIRDSLCDVLSPGGIKTVPVPDWNGQPDSLKGLQADSILRVEIKRFWIEGNATLLGTDIKTSVSLVIRLGVKKEGKVFTRSIDLERTMKDIRLSPPQAQKILNQMITEIFDGYFSNPY